MSLSGQILFTDVSTDVGIVEEYRSNHQHGLGAAWIDFNNDGWPDIFASNGFNKTPHLYQNVDSCPTTTRCFALMDDLLPELPNVEIMGAVFADYDNDGDDDLYLFTDNEALDLADPAFSPSDGPANILLRNRWVETGGVLAPGEKLFEDATVEAGLEDLAEVPFGGYPAYRSTSGGWLDYDRDGFVDLYVAHWDVHRGGQLSNRDRLYHNNGDGTFTDVTASSGVNDGSDPMLDRPALAFLAAHLDGDNWPDMYVVNVHDDTPLHEDLMYLNNADGTFTESTGLSIGFGDDTQSGMGIDVADIDHDGNWDIYISDLLFNSQDASDGNSLNLGNGDGTFSDNVAVAHGVQGHNSWGVNFFDADQDGWEDLFVSGTGLAGQNFFYQNDQDGTFTDISAASGTMGSSTPNYRGAAVADYDHDGDLDLLQQETGGFLTLYQNDSANAGHWLQLDLEGTISNRSAIGAVVKILLESGGDTIKSQIVGGVSAHSQDSSIMHFGVGDRTVVKRVTVRWPQGGETSLFNVPTDQLLELSEEDATIVGFTDVTAEAGLTCDHGYIAGEPTTPPLRISGGVAVGDYDNDGWPDLYTVSGDIGPNILFHNNQDGTFTIATPAELELTDHIDAAPAFGDIDGDGFLDLFVGAADGDTPKVFRSLGDGNFEDITAITGISSTRNTFSTTFGDYNGDGLIDIVSAHWDVGGTPCPAPACTGHLWKSNGDLTFTDDDVAAGITGYESDDRTFAPNLTDINGDGALDLLMVGDFGTSMVFLNDGDGTFTNTTDGAVITDMNGMGTAVADYDNDGDFDWFVSSIYDPDVGRTGNRLYRNLGDGSFEDATDEAGVREGFWGWGACLSDFNNDGHLDLFHTNGFATPWHDDPSRLFMANGDGTFGEESLAFGIDDTDEGRGVSCFDYDRDGDLDIFVANNSAPCSLYRNDLVGANNFLNLTLRSRTDNVFGVGSVIRVTVGGETQSQEFRAGTNFSSQQPLEAHFGLGNVAIASKIVVEWPDGVVNTVPAVGANQFLEIKQVYDSVGLFRGNNGFFQWNENADNSTFDQRFRIGTSAGGKHVIAGDWDGDGIDTVGSYDPVDGTFLLAAANASGGVVFAQFVFGSLDPALLPVAGDWDGDGIDSIGLFDPATKTFELRNSNDAGPADLTFAVNPSGTDWLPVIGDWNADGVDTIGVFRASDSRFLLRDSNATGSPDYAFGFPVAVTPTPITGDWNGDGMDTVGIWDGGGRFQLLDGLAGGPADHDFTVAGGVGSEPMTGVWN